MKIIQGLDYFPNYLSKEQIDILRRDINFTLMNAPLFKPTMPKTGRELSVKMSNMGDIGWVSDKIGGYRYQSYHPDTKQKWPKISNCILDIWREVTNLKISPDCCLINYYDSKSKMGLHVDNDEKDFSHPVLSISIGNSALFRFGGLKRSDKTRSIKLNNGDVLMMSGQSRLIYHGIDKVYPSSCFDHRINLTLRKI
jgi:alkylated DNA repair protein (DNA oxidative demethylase)